MIFRKERTPCGSQVPVKRLPVLWALHTRHCKPRHWMDKCLVLVICRAVIKDWPAPWRGFIWLTGYSPSFRKPGQELNTGMWRQAQKQNSWRSAAYRLTQATFLIHGQHLLPRHLSSGQSRNWPNRHATGQSYQLLTESFSLGLSRSVAHQHPEQPMIPALLALMFYRESNKQWTS